MDIHSVSNMTFRAIVLMMLYFSNCEASISWNSIRCSADGDQKTIEGKVPDIGRFPWLGVVQHSFYLGEKTRFAITTAVLIHPGFAIAPAEDMARIQTEALSNNTKFIVWQRESVKYIMDVFDYFLHPQYLEQVTFATLALLQLNTQGETGVGDVVAPVLPICMPVKGSGVYSDLYAVKMTDEDGELQKEMLKINFVERKDCDEFYVRANLNYKKMTPLNSLCGVSEDLKQSCVWDGGVALIARQSYGFWKLIGFGVRGPGCGAPARFLNIHDYLPWIDETISQRPNDVREEGHRFILRTLTPYKLIMYKADVKIPRDLGSCERGKRGSILYKDSSEFLVNKNFAQGYFYVEVQNIATVNCVSVILDVNSRTNVGVWLEHHCVKDATGDRQRVKQKSNLFKNVKALECFIYFKSTAYLEFRFYFSFKAILEVTLFGTPEDPRIIPNPNKRSEYTDNWWPTDRIIRWGYFVPYYVWWYDM